VHIRKDDPSDPYPPRLSRRSSPFDRSDTIATRNARGRARARRVIRTKWWVLLAAVLIVALASGIFWGVSIFFPGQDEPDIAAVFPGKAVGTMDESASEQADHLRKGVAAKLMKDGLVAEYCRVPGEPVKKTLEQSDRFLLADQIEWMSFLAEQGDKRGFRELYESVVQRYARPMGLFAEEPDRTDSVEAEDSGKDPGDDNSDNNDGNDDNDKNDDTPRSSVAHNIRFCRVLLEGYVRFDDARYLTAARELSEILVPLCEKYGLPPHETWIVQAIATPTPDFSATPTPRPTGTPSMEPDPSNAIHVIDLSTIDLVALELLTALDPRWDAIYEKSRAVIRGALLSEPAPLFQAGYDPDNDGYAPYLGTSPAFDTDRQMAIALHLSEVGELPDRTYAYLKQLVMNNRAFYRSYNILTAAPMPSRESIKGYASMARMARMADDPVLYAFCVGRIYWNSADSPTSRIFGLTFFETDDETIWAYADEAIPALKALY
jgi:hypothetical protein